MKNIYDIKNDLLNFYAEKVSPYDFYRDVFPIGSFEEKGIYEDKKANGILCTVKNGKGNHRLVFDDLEEISNHLDDDFVIISPIAYFGRRRSSANASMLFGIVFDLDYVNEKELRWILERLENPHFPRATYIVNSGGGIHLYYLLKQPIPLYRSIHKKLNKFKHSLTNLIWNKYTSSKGAESRQYQGIFQGFRMVGSACKMGKEFRVSAYKTGEKVDIDYLNNYVNPESKISSLDYESSLTLEEAKLKYPDWYNKRIINNQSVGKWAIRRSLYDWWLNKIKTDPDLRVGHRYWCICVLASYAYKCSFYDERKNPNPVTEQELRKDAYSLLPLMQNLQDDFEVDDVESALNFYQESYISFPREEIIKVSGLTMPENRRNFRSQDLHLKGARAIQEINNPDWRNVEGRPNKQDIILQWRYHNPNGTKAECIRQTKLSKKTVYKWW